MKLAFVRSYSYKQSRAC